MPQDIADERRSKRITIFLQSLENYITELARINHGATQDQIANIFKQNFSRSMLANAEYHEQMIRENENAGDASIANVHQLYAKIYRSILAN